MAHELHKYLTKIVLNVITLQFGNTNLHDILLEMRGVKYHPPDPTVHMFT